MPIGSSVKLIEAGPVQYSGTIANRRPELIHFDCLLTPHRSEMSSVHWDQPIPTPCLLRDIACHCCTPFFLFTQQQIHLNSESYPPLPHHVTNNSNEALLC